ncbi:formate C-acetyltransferase [Escherichia coli]|nr:formate C-acetyltransferase [Escherichia coli]EFL9647502.1 formate C-acetyltransferase [Escherichia coli]EFQ6925906.1 formate C-acetyltransferase [Escherichia coli]EHI0530346.1 formate C-acetyltransferase [Escherichia coli]MHX61986.1 formate C-acetyltransferase [Escherichia coli]
MNELVQILKNTRQHLMTGVSHMIPFVVSGGILLAVSVMLYGKGAVPDAVADPNLKKLFDIGVAGLTLMVPFLAAYIGYSIAERSALAPCAIGAWVGNSFGAGFFGALIAGIIGGIVVHYLKKIPVHKVLRSVMPIFIIPIVGTLITAGIMMWGLGEPVSLGRFDQYMLPFYQTSLTQGEDAAFLKELLESLWVKCNDIVLLRSTSSARYFAGFPTGYTALLGGLTENGRSAVNVLSFLCLDAYQSVQLPQPNLGVRTNALIDTPFLMKTAETIRLGTGIPQIFNDEVVVPAFLNRGVSLEDARDYSVVGCVELSIPGRTYGLHDIAMFNLLKVMEICLYENEGNAALTYEGLLEQIRAKISHYITLMVEGSNICDIGHRDWAPVPLLSSFISDCLEKGRDITDGGARYNFSGVQGIGIANLSDSLHALKGMVFEQQRLSFDELLSVLKANFATPEGEKVRARLINRFEKYGNDIDEVDNISAELLRHYCKEVEKYQNPRGGYFTPGSYTVSAHVPLGSVVGATPDGRFAGEQLADGGLSPMLGQDAQGPTAVLKSVSKLDNTLLSNGTLLNVKFTPATLEGEAGLRKLADFLRAFTQLKLQHIQFNVVNADTLREAQQRPQDYAGLVVRVAGYSAFFVELSKEIQDDIIRRTAHQL